ncbi:co-chaperone GroES [Adhaeretor mobilis]|uniref:Co-chaperonin GroES n=1 Tax=Adhaeretor mobilis TaxID=1930276 RepID=A0A517MRB7_9BACT|nr:co-chaperone GroES [Adhaeretor mobilis]QDS97421.1 10 kDa chaperonin [Adhaeretor mobilis]
MAAATKKKPSTKKKSKVALQPLGDKVVVERDESLDTTAGGIVLPDSAKDKPSRGTIIAIGTGKLLDDGSRGSLQVKKGDRILFTSYAPETITVGDDEYLLMSESDILAVIE